MSHPSSIKSPLPRRTAEQLITHLDDALARSGAGALATDADGTIWDGDVGIDLFETLLAHGAVREAARGALSAEAAHVGIAAEGSPSAICAALYEAYKEGRYDHERAFAMMAWVFAGFSQGDLATFVGEVLDRGRIEARFRPAMKAIFYWAEQRGVPVYVVSASPIAIVTEGIQRLGIAARRVLAMTPALDGSGVVLPALDGPVVYGEGKVQVLERAEAGPILGAFGDSAFDAPMLRRAAVPVAITPSRELVALAPSIDGIVELDR